MISKNEKAQFLVESARRGEKGAMEQLIELFHPEIFRLVYYRTRSRMDAEDITQEVFMQMMNKLATLNDPNSFRSWLYRMAVNKVYDFQRKKKVKALLGFSAQEHESSGLEVLTRDDHTPIDLVERNNFWEKVKYFTQRLSRMEREVFMLRFMDQLTIEEIAEVVKKSDSAVKTHLYRAVSKFRNDRDFIQFLKEVGP